MVRGRLVRLHWRTAMHKDAGGGLGRPSSRSCGKRRDRHRRCAAWAASFARGWDEVNQIIAAANAYTDQEARPDRVIGFSPIRAMSWFLRRRQPLPRLIGGVCCELLRLVLRPAAASRRPGASRPTSRSADWYNSTFLIAWGSNVPQTRTPDAHFTEVRYNRVPSRGGHLPDYPRSPKFADMWLPQAGHRRGAGDGDGPRS